MVRYVTRFTIDSALLFYTCYVFCWNRAAMLQWTRQSGSTMPRTAALHAIQIAMVTS